MGKPIMVRLVWSLTNSTLDLMTTRSLRLKLGYSSLPVNSNSPIISAYSTVPSKTIRIEDNSSLNRRLFRQTWLQRRAVKNLICSALPQKSQLLSQRITGLLYNTLNRVHINFYRWSSFWTRSQATLIQRAALSPFQTPSTASRTLSITSKLQSVPQSSH